MSDLIKRLRERRVLLRKKFGLTGQVLAWEREIDEAIEEIERLTAEVARAKDGCAWTEDEGIWESECGQTFEFNADGPTENGFKFCHHCGRELVSSRRSPEDE